jgi:hypothetical protein
VKNLPARDPFASQLVYGILKARITPPEDRPLADAIFEKDDCHLTADTLNLSDMQFEVFFPQARELGRSPIVGTHRSDVPRPQAEPRASRERRRYLAAGFDPHLMQMYLRIWPRKRR